MQYGRRPCYKSFPTTPIKSVYKPRDPTNEKHPVSGHDRMLFCRGHFAIFCKKIFGCHKSVTNLTADYRFYRHFDLTPMFDFSRKYVILYFLSALVERGDYIVKYMENAHFSANLRDFCFHCHKSVTNLQRNFFEQSTGGGTHFFRVV